MQKLPAELRRDQIAAFVQEQENTSAEELGERFGVSLMTVWRDLTTLEEAGRVRRVRIHVQRREIPRELLGGNYENDLAVRERFQQWINGIWAEKDRLIGSM